MPTNQSCVHAKVLQYGLQPTSLLCPWNPPGKSTGVGCYALFQGISSPMDQTHVAYVSCIGRQVLYP